MLIIETEFLSGLTTQTYLPSGVTAMGLELDGPSRIGASAAAARMYGRTTITPARNAATMIMEVRTPALVTDIELPPIPNERDFEYPKLPALDLQSISQTGIKQDSNGRRYG